MAVATLTRPDLGMREQDARLNYGALLEKMNQAAALASALRASQEPDTHAFYLAALLDELMSRAERWYKLDQYFAVDHNGDPVEVQHG